jgi:CRISPR-associated protein (TIGR03984 family)
MAVLRRRDKPVTILHSRAADGISLPEAIRVAVPDHAIAFLASPGRYQVTKVRGSACYGPVGLCSLDEVFEARAFNPEAEMRWLHVDSGLGRAVVLAEEEHALPTGFGQPLSPLVAAEVFPQRYMLWGRPTPPRHDGWISLYAARVGMLEVPLTASGRGRRVYLTAREYISVDPDHGNAYVAEERLLTLEEDSR